MANQPNAPQQSVSAPAGFQFGVVYAAFPNTIHGTGVFTTAQILAGDLILEEEPFFCLGLGEFNVPQNARLHPRWQTLPAWSSSPSGHGQDYDKFKANALRCGSSIVPNSYAEDDLLGIFLLASWMNSSCTPNVHAHWNIRARRMEFRAVRIIEALEELCICYDVSTLLYSKEHRQQRLRDTHGFTCCCPVCSQDPPPEHQRSIVRNIIETGGGTNPLEVIGNIRSAIKGLHDNGLYHFGDTLHYDLYQALKRARNNNAMLCLLTARNLARVMVGKDDSRVRHMTGLLHPNWRENYSLDCRAGCCQVGVRLDSSLPSDRLRG